MESPTKRTKSAPAPIVPAVVAGGIELDAALCLSSSLGWMVAGVVVLFPSLYYVVVHLLAIVGFFAVASSTTARQIGADIQRGVAHAISQRVALIAAPASHPAHRHHSEPLGVG